MEVIVSSATFQGDRAKADITLSNQLTSPLLRLPAEIRNAIYTYLGYETQTQVTATIGQSDNLANNSDRFVMHFQLPGLLESCKQIRYEASPVLCAQLAVEILADDDAWYWLHSNCKHKLCDQVTSLRILELHADSIELEVYFRQRHRRLDNIKARTMKLPSLKRVHVMCHMSKKAGGFNDWTAKRLRNWFDNEALQIVFEIHERPYLGSFSLVEYHQSMDQLDR